MKDTKEEEKRIKNILLELYIKSDIIASTYIF